MMRRNSQQNGYRNGRSNGPANDDHDESDDVQREESRKPVHQLNYQTGNGSMIWVSIWDSSFEVEGKLKVAFSVTYKRSYFHDKQWKTSENVRGSELHVLIHALNQASIWCLEAARQ